MNAQHLAILLELAKRANSKGLVSFEEYPAVYEAVKSASDQISKSAQQPDVLPSDELQKTSEG